MGGLMGITGEEDGGPVKVGVAMTDIATGLYTYGAITSALYHRERTGEGQYIDLSLLDTQVLHSVSK
jgi:crotonobetainyl-CoA:carnitine CoA-transferase CaiB-like acyl-CoA transferase